MQRTWPSRIALTVASLLVATTTVLLAGTTTAGAAIHRPLHDARAVGSSPVTAPFQIEYFGLVADLVGPAPEADAAQVRFRVAGRWTGWQELTEDGAQAAGTFTAALVAVDHADAYQVRDVAASLRHARAAVLNTSNGPVVGHEPGPGAAHAASLCRSRADWNADETITAWSRGTDTPAFAPAQVITVHHTAGSNDPNQDFAATVRAIETYHVKTNGWSDIGYQYLIDPNGVLYEGRYSGHTSRSCLTGGGDGSDFGHRSTDDAVVTGAHVAGYNTGNLGISLLGCFDDQAACAPGTYGAGDTTPTAGARSTLQQTIARLSARHGFNPTGTTNYSNGTNAKTGINVVSAHRDFEATACPGGNLYVQLSAVRSAAAQLLTPAALSASATATTAHLMWQQQGAWPSAPEATRYRLTRDGTTIGSTSTHTFDDATVSPSTTYTYQVTAVATDGSSSSGTASVTVTTPAAAATSPDFDVSINPSTASTVAGTALSPTVSTNAKGETGAIALQAHVDRPSSGVTATLAFNSVAAGGSTQLNVDVGPSATGTYTVVVQASATASHQATYVVVVSNRDPVVTLAAPTCSGSGCTYSASASDPDGGPVSLAWSLPGATPSTAGNVSSVSASYASAGTYTVTAQGTDVAGRTGSAAAKVTCTWIGKTKTRTLRCTNA